CSCSGVTTSWAAPYGLLQAVNPNVFHPFDKASDDGFGQGRPLEHQPCINLNEARSSCDFLPGIVRVENAADTDDGQFSFRLPVNMPHQFCAALPQWTTAQPTRFGIDSLGVNVGGLR